MTENAKKIQEWQASRPAFTGKVVAQQLPGKQARRTAKAQLVKKASGK